MDICHGVIMSTSKYSPLVMVDKECEDVRKEVCNKKNNYFSL